jgi:hypothetical protein
VPKFNFGGSEEGLEIASLDKKKALLLKRQSDPFKTEDPRE